MARWGKSLVIGATAALAVVAIAAALVLPPAVPVARATRRPLVQRLVVTGRVLAPARIEVGPLLAGNVAALHVEEGDPVEAVQPLLRLDDVEEQAAVAQARAALAEARARAEQLRTVQAPQARAAVRRAEAELEQARGNHERYRALHDRGATSDAALEEAARRLDVAEAEVMRSRLALEGAAGGAEARLAAAAVARAEAALDLAEARLERTVLRAPVPGVVLRRTVEVGQAVQPGQVLLELGAAGATEIEIEPDERNVGALRVGQEVLVSADAFPDDRFRAEVKRIAPRIDRQQGTVAVRLAVPAPPAYLRPGMTVSADVEVARVEDALVLPVEAVRDAASGRPWTLVIEDGRAVRRQLRLGIRGERWVEVREGVAAGEAAIPAPSEVEPGARVRAGEVVAP